LQGKASPEFLANAVAIRERLLPPQIEVTHLRNNADMLAGYNRRVVEQCSKRVYCATKDNLMLAEPPFAMAGAP